MESPQLNYRTILQEEFARRKKRNPSYSLRSYARDLKLCVASVSNLLSGKQGLSPLKAKQVAQILELEESEMELFCTLVESRHARAKVNREQAQKKLGAQELKVTDLSMEYFKVISEWYYYAILELPGVADFRSDTKWIANRLGISASTTTEAINRLIRLELLEEDARGNYKKVPGFLSAIANVPNRSIKNHHRQMLQKADVALDEQSVEESDFTGVTFSMNTEDLKWAKEEIKKFRRALSTRLSANKNKNRLYQLNFELFALDQIENGNEYEK